MTINVSTRKISDQTIKMPRNESKNDIIMVNEITFPMYIQYSTPFRHS